MTVRLGRQLVMGSMADGRRRVVEGARVNERADFSTGSSGMMGGGAGLSMGGGTAPAGLLEDLYNGFVPPNPQLMRRLYREMYRSDSVVGAAVDSLSTFPFSNFNLVGVSDERMLRKYQQSLDMLDIRTLLPSLTTDYLVYGQFVATLNWNEREKIFDALLPQNLDFCLTGDTKVLTADGWRTIFELAEPLKRGYYPITYQINGQFHQGTAPFCTGRRHIMRLSLSNGTHLKGTTNHPVQCLRPAPDSKPWEIEGKRNLVPTWVNIGDIQVGDKLLLEDYEHPAAEHTREFYEAFAIGVLMGDGSVYKGHPTFTCYNDKQEIVEVLQRAGVVASTEETFDAGRRLKGIRVVFNHRMRELMARYAFSNKLSAKIDNHTQLMGYLSGLIMTDGWVDRNHVNVAGGADYMVQLRDLLLMYGYPHFTVDVRAPDSTERSIYKDGEHINYYKTNKPMHTLRFGKRSIQRLAASLLLVGKKHTKLATLLAIPNGKSLQRYATTTVVAKSQAGRAYVYDLHVPNLERFVANGVIVHNCSLQNLPIYGVDPVVTIQLPQELVRLLNGGKGMTDELRENIKRIPDEFLNRMTQPGGIKLSQQDVLYITRGGMTADYEGLSLLSRCLPVWLMEKALIRGTFDQVWKRQRPILHAQMGSDTYEPQASDYEALRDMIIGADLDPNGAVLVTRDGISINEFRRGDDFWRWDSFYDFARQAKQHAMGISDAFQTGDSTISAVEGAINVTMRNYDSFRTRLTKDIFYDKILPTIAIANNFRRRPSNILTGAEAGVEEAAWFDPIKRSPVDGSLRAEIASSGVNVYNTNLTPYAIPKVVWDLSLTDTNDSNRLDTLKALQDMGLPIAMRELAAAGGQSIEQILEQADSDIKIRLKIKAWREAIKKADPTGSQMMMADSGIPQEGSDAAAGDSGGFDMSSLRGPVPLSPPAPDLGSTERVGLTAREYGDAAVPRRWAQPGTLGRLSARGQADVNESMNRKLAEAAGRAHARRVHEHAATAPEPTRRYYPMGH